MDTLEVVDIGESDIPSCAAILAQAFDPDPLQTEFTAAHAEAAGITALAGVMGPDATGRSLRIWRLFAEARAKEAGTRYWYLLMIGVRPACQGQGIGSALMRPALARADDEGLPCFVETVQPRNRPPYERHAFHLVRDHVDPESGALRLREDDAARDDRSVRVRPAPALQLAAVLAWGVFFKRPTVWAAALALGATAFLVATARAEEAENVGYFGDAYREYMRKTTMFLPFVL